MRKYKNRQQHIEQYMEQAASDYWHGLQERGLKPNSILLKAAARRALDEAERDYTQHASATRDHNIALILSEHQKRLRQIKRDGAKLRLMMCPPLAAFFGVLAWYSFSHTGGLGLAMGIAYSIGALAFLAMLALGAMFDR
ncbi:MAG: hypothetical protein ACRDHZ_08705 [Ktedonobacteraceae bacterium]